MDIYEYGLDPAFQNDRDRLLMNYPGNASTSSTSVFPGRRMLYIYLVDPLSSGSTRE